MVERGARGDDVVDQQHTGCTAECTRNIRTCPKAGTLQAFGTTVPRLRTRAVFAVQQTPTRNTEVSRHGARDQLGLIEPTRPTTGGTRGRPRDDAHPHERPHTHALHGKCRQLVSHTTPRAVLQRVQQLTHHTGVGEGGQHVSGQRHLQLLRGGGTQHRKSTPWTHEWPGRPTPGAVGTYRTEGNVHTRVLLRGCHRVRRD